MTRTIATTLGTLACTSSLLLAAPLQSDDAYDDLIPFEFEGGTLPEYLNAIDEQFDECSIVIFPGGLEKIQVPAMKVNTYGYDDLFQLIEGSEASGGDPRRNTYWSIQPDLSIISDTVYSVRPIVSGSPFAAATSGSTNTSVSVYASPRNFEMAQVLDAIGAGIEMAVGDDGATVRFHEPTRLIFVETSSTGHEVVRDILEELQHSVPAKGFGGEEPGGSSRLKDLTARFEDAMDRNARLKDQLLELEAANTRLRIELEERTKGSNEDGE